VPFQYYGSSRTGWGSNRFVNDLGTEMEQFVMIQPVTADFFATIGADLRGNEVEPVTPDASPVPVVVSGSLARQLFAEREPMGRVFQGLSHDGHLRQLRVVGVVSGLRHWGLDQGDALMLYVPWEPFGADMDFAALAVRTDRDPETVLSALRDAVWDLDPDMPLPDIFTIPERMARSVAAPRFYSALLITFATVALLLAAGGIYGVMLYSVGRRRHELGVRAALGADRPVLVRLVLASSARVTVIGLIMGLAAALLATRALRSMLFGVSATDPLTLGAVAFLMGAVAIAASVVPAWRAARIDPLEAMRAE